MAGLGRRDRALDPGPLDGGLEDLALGIRHRLHATVLDQVGDDGSVAVVAEASGVNGRRHEVVTEGVHRQQRRHAGRVAEVVVEAPTGQRGARGRLDGDEAHVGVGDERQRDPPEVRSPAAAGDDDVGALLARQRELLLCLQADHRLVQEDVIEHRAQ